MPYQSYFSYRFNQGKIIAAAINDAPRNAEIERSMGGAKGGVCQLISLMWLALSDSQQGDPDTSDMGANYAQTAIHSSSAAAYWRMVCQNFGSLRFSRYQGKAERLTDEFRLLSKNKKACFAAVVAADWDHDEPTTLEELCTSMKESFAHGFHGFKAYIRMTFADRTSHGCALRIVNKNWFMFFDPNFGIAYVRLSELQKFLEAAAMDYCISGSTKFAGWGAYELKPDFFS